MSLKLAQRLFGSGNLLGKNIFSPKTPAPQLLSRIQVKCFSAIPTGLDCPRVQAPAPDFHGIAVINNEFKDIKLADYTGKYLYLFFYPLDFTFVCPTEIIAFSDRIKEFEEINTSVVGVSCDSHFSHLAWINTPRKSGGLGDLKYPLLSDFKKSIAKSYNVLIDSDGVALRGSFIIDPVGIVRQITVNDLPVGRSVDEVLRLIKAFQFVDKHGEALVHLSPVMNPLKGDIEGNGGDTIDFKSVCPANWNPDKPTIKPNPKGSQEYFNKVN